MKKYFFIAWGIGLAAVSYPFFFHQQARTDASEYHQIAPTLANSASKQETKNTGSKMDAIVVKCSVTSPIFSNGKPPAIATKISDDGAAYELVHTQTAKAKTLARTEPSAAIALYTMIASCYPSLIYRQPQPTAPHPSCPRKDEVSDVNVLEIIEAAADSSSVEAKAFYLLNIPLVAKKIRSTGGSGSSVEAERLLRRAEMFGIQAAQAGSAAALRQMSYAYEQGDFGVPDKVRAYAFALPLLAIGDDADKNRVIALDKMLSSESRSIAQAIAYGCPQQINRDEMKNPFVSN